MTLVFGLWLFVLGMLAASSLVIAKRPDAKHVIASLAPYQGWIGVVSALNGAWGIVRSVLNIGMLAHWPISWATMLASSALLLALGFILGIGVLKSFIRNPTAAVRMDETLTRLAPHQGRLGVIAMGVGLWTIVSGFLWHVG
jgi:hypothetical protein